MTNEEKTKAHLKNELVELRQRITELEASEIQQKREKETLKTLSVQWQTTFDAISDAVCLLDPEGMILQGNKAMMQLVGKSSGELIGRTCYELMHGTSKRPEECPVIRMQETCRRENLVLPLDDRCLNVTVDPLLDDDGSINGAVHIIADITERKQAEQALRRERDNFISILESMADGVYSVNQNYDIEYVNSILKQEFGLPEGRKCYVYFHDRKEICPWCKNQEVLSGKTVRWEWYSFKNNKTYDLIDTPIKNPDGSVSKLEIFRDITDRKQAEDEVKKSKQMLEGIAQGITESLLLLSKDLKIIWANKAALEEYGYELEDIIGKSCYQVTHSQESPCESPLDPCPIYELQETDTPQTQTHTHADTEGNKKFVEVSAYPVKDEKGQVAQFVYVSKNITEHKRADEKIKEMKDKYESLIINIPDVIYSSLPDETSTTTFVSERITDWTGCSAEEFYKDNELWSKCIHPEDRDKTVEAYIEASKQKKEYIFEYTIIHQATGEVRYLKDHGMPIMDEQGELIRFDGILTDITEKRKMEEELLKIEKLESLGVLAGGIAHDFNNVLTGILSNISLAKQYAHPEDKVFERLIEAEKASVRAKDLTQQLLTFARSGAPIKKIISMVELLKDTVAFALSGSNVYCEFSLPEELWSVEVDEGQINRVIHNLVINADQAMPEGGIVTVSAENTILGVEDALPLHEENYVKITMKDQGIGIPKDHLAKIFDPYFTTKHKGSGLGLTVAYSIIKNHEGHITVDSELGVGTTFAIYLPASEKPIPTKKEEEGLVFGKGWILVMDDEEVIREAIGEILTYLGYQVEFAKNGEEAIALYKKNKDSDQPFDAVILDLTIPGGMGGMETIKQLIELDPDVKAVVSSGYSTDPVMAYFRDYGFRGVVAKPYDIKGLSETLHKVIKGNDE